jgi:L-ascorbate metabolism protein UlaG (beta-lactamase superfamily)
MGSQNQNLGGWRARRLFGYLWHEWIGERWRPIAPASARPNPAEWSDNRLTTAWLGHATVLINFFGIKILTDPVLFPRIGIRLPGLTVGPKRLTAPALTIRDLPKIDIVLLSHAHFDHFDNRRIIFSGDTALSDSFEGLRAFGPIDLAIMPIGAYNPWIHSHCTPEQAVQMANEAGAHFIMPVHHQTFRFSAEGFREPIERIQTALHETPERIALREIGETFVLP